MRNVTVFSLTLLAIGAILLSSPAAYAGTDQYGQYGQQPGEGQQPTQPAEGIMVDKMVARPGTDTTKGGISTERFVDNLSANDARFQPNSQVIFRIKVKNTSNATLRNVTLRDYVPQYMEPVTTPGNYDSGTRTITYVIPEIRPGEEKSYDFVMKFVAQNRMPADKSIICVINKAEVTTGAVSDEDTSQVCVEKQVIGVDGVPKTGPELGLLVLAGNILGLGAGTYLKRMKKNA